MGQSQSKTTNGEDAKPGGAQPLTEANKDAGSVSAASSAASSSSLSTKLFKMFSKPIENVSTTNQTPSALYKSPYAPASPLPPSSSTLAQSFRNELTGGSPVQPKQNNSFFLGKVLISPRRPLREYKSSTFRAVTSPLVTSNAGLPAKNVVRETPNYNLSTPKSLKRKASSPEYGNRSKSSRLERTASPALKDPLLARTRDAQVEEQEEEAEEKQLSVPPTETKKKDDLVADDGDVISTETVDGFEEINSVDEIDHNKVADEGMEENVEYSVSDPNNCSSHQKLVDESSMTAPYSPSQQPKSLVSAIDISLSSLISCASPATVVFRRNSTLDDLNVSDAEDNESTITSQGRDETVLQKLKDLKEYFLPSPGADSIQDSSVADNTPIEEPYSLPAASDNNAVDMNSHSRIESMEVPARKTTDAFEEDNNCDQLLPKADDHCAPESNLGLESVSIEYNGHSSASETSETSSYSKMQSEDDMEVNTLPQARTTDSSTTSNKQWLSVFKMTDSKQKNDGGEGKEASKISDAVHMRPRCSEDAYYHYPPVLSTFTSSVSNMKWPPLSLISTSSASALGISSVDLFKSLPFFGQSSIDNIASSSKESKSAAETASTGTDASSPKTCDDETSAVASTNSSVELELADASVEELLNDDNDDLNGVSEMETGNNKSPNANGSLNITSVSVSEPSGLRIPSEQQNWTPKRSRRIASRCTTTPNSSNKACDAKNDPIQDPEAVAVSESEFLSNATPLSANRRRRRRSPSTDSNASKQSASQISLDLSPASSSRCQMKRRRRTGGSINASLQEVPDVSEDETQKPVDDNVSSSNSLETSKDSHGTSVEDDSTVPSKKSNEPRSKRAKIEGVLQKTVAVLRENHSAEYISNSQVLILVRPANSSSGALMRQLRLQFPQGSFVSSTAGGPQHKKKKRGNSDSSRQVERCIMQGRSPIVVEAARSVSVVPYLCLAHSANYNTVLYNEDCYLNIAPRKSVKASLPFCYSWFLNLTDSLELSQAGKQFMSRLLSLSSCRRDLAARTHHDGSVAELLSSYIPNNIVGGPKILHCTAKGGASTDPAYSAKPEVVAAVGSTTTLRIVGFVLTPRTFGARVKLTSEQMLVWGNPDDPAIPKEIGQLFAEQEEITAEQGPLVGHTAADDDEAIAGSPQANGLEDSNETGNSPTLNKITKKSFKPVPLGNDLELTYPSRCGSRAHITLGCFSRDVHPRTTGYDLLKVIEKEQQAKKQSLVNNGAEDRTTVEESDHESDMEVDGESSTDPKPSASAETDAILTVGSPSAEEKSSGETSVSVGLGDAINKGDWQSKDNGTVASIRVEGATVRCYGDGIWVVYPDQIFEVTALFSGFYNSD